MAHPCERVLVVEDDADLRESIVDFLRSEGIEPRAAANGDEAIAALGRPPPPDAILLDLGMPGMTGDELVRRIRAQPEWAHIPVAVMSGYPRGRFAYTHGVTEYLEKPFNLDRLNEVLSTLCRARTGTTGTR